MTQPTLTLELPDEHATDRLGQALAHLAAALKPDALGKLLPGPSAGGRIHLKGDLGAGKTALFPEELKVQVTHYLNLIKFLTYTSIILIFIDLAKTQIGWMLGFAISLRTTR